MLFTRSDSEVTSVSVSLPVASTDWVPIPRAGYTTAEGLTWKLENENEKVKWNKKQGEEKTAIERERENEREREGEREMKKVRKKKKSGKC